MHEVWDSARASSGFHIGDVAVNIFDADCKVFDVDMK